MNLYRSNDLLEGPAVEVCLLRNFCFGVTWSPRKPNFAWLIRYFGIHIGPLSIIWRWPYSEEAKRLAREQGTT